MAAKEGSFTSVVLRVVGVIALIILIAIVFFVLFGTAPKKEEVADAAGEKSEKSGEAPVSTEGRLTASEWERVAKTVSDIHEMEHKHTNMCGHEPACNPCAKSPRTPQPYVERPARQRETRPEVIQVAHVVEEKFDFLPMPRVTPLLVEPVNRRYQTGPEVFQNLALGASAIHLATRGNGGTRRQVDEENPPPPVSPPVPPPPSVSTPVPPPPFVSAPVPVVSVPVVGGMPPPVGPGT